MTKMDFKILQIPLSNKTTSFELVLIGDVYMLKTYESYFDLYQSVNNFLKESPIKTTDDYTKYLYDRHSMYENLKKATSKKKACVISQHVNDMLSNSPTRKSGKSGSAMVNRQISKKLRSESKDKSIESALEKSPKIYKTVASNTMSDQKYANYQFQNKKENYSEVGHRNNFLGEDLKARKVPMLTKPKNFTKRNHARYEKSPLAMTDSSRDQSEYLLCTLNQRRESPSKAVVIRNLNLDSARTRNQPASTFKNSVISGVNIIDTNLSNIKNIKENISQIDQDYLQALKEVMEDYSTDKIETSKNTTDRLGLDIYEKTKSYDFSSFLCSSSNIINVPETNNDNYFFSLDLKGCLKQYCMKTEELVHDYHYIVHPQNEFYDKQNKRVLNISFDEKYIFVCDPYCNLIQIDIKNRKVLNKFPDAYESSQFMIICTKNAESLFLISNDGCMKQFDIKKVKMKKDFGRIHEGQINSICMSHDDKFLFTSDEFGNLKQWSVPFHQLSKDWGKISENGILCIMATKDGNSLIIGDTCGILKLIDLRDLTVKKQYLDNHKSGVSSQAVSNDGKWLFSADLSGNVYQWDIHNLKFHQVILYSDQGFIHSGGIWIVNIAPDGRSLFTTDCKGFLRKWDILTQELITEFGNLQILSRYSRYINF